MNCWECERPAQGVCAFCGRAVCKDHVQSMPNILAAYSDKNGEPKLIAVQDALHCGTCKPNDEPVSLGPNK